jgi:hypothetical protein
VEGEIMFGWKLIKEKDYEELRIKNDHAGVVARLNHMCFCSKYISVATLIKNYCMYNVGNEHMMDHAIDKEIKNRGGIPCSKY